MATIAHPTSSGLGITAPSDAMDLHSDNGYDVGDGDIDLEFESAATVYHQDDDDLLLQDALPDLGLDLHATHPDQDDFMADKDDLIEEDEIEYGDVEVVDAAQPSPNSYTIAEATTAEEDLIDYSDEEEEPPNVTQEASPRIEEALETRDAAVDPAASPSSFDNPAAESLNQDAEGQSYDYNEEEHSNEQGLEGDTNQPWDATETDWEQIANNSEYNAELPVDGQDEYHQQQESVELQGENKIVSEPVQLDEPATADKIAQAQQDALEEQQGHINEQAQVHPVTINYDGVEFWLFRPSESEDNEDWLLSDRSIQGKLLNELFQACRVALHNDINQDTEIGFRFDHFHNLEIYEDSTACLFVKLQDLITTYLELHAQDGTLDPESFYITLQFRPRVSTLLGELNKAVRDRVGYSGLNTAVAAGQTAFNTPFSNNEQNDGVYENWEEEQEESEHNDGIVQPDEQCEDVEETVSLETSSHETGHDGQDLKHYSPAAPHSINGNDNMSNKEVSLAEDFEQDVIGTLPGGVQPPLVIQSHEEEGDTIQYGDEEHSTDHDQAGQASAPISVHDPSSGSSTVQGDDDNRQHDSTALLESSHQDTEQLANSEGGALEIGHDDEETHPEFDAEFPSYEDSGIAPEAYDDETFNQAFEHGYDEETASQPYRTEEYETQEPYTADNSYYDDEADANPHEDLNLPNTIEDNSNFDGTSNQPAGNENFADVDDTFDSYVDETTTIVDGITTTIEADRASLDYGANDASEEDYINYEDDEDGTVEQRTVATSAAAQPIAASSSGPDHAGSPQGLKRSIDEVGNGLDAGTDLSDAKRPRV